MGSKTIITQMDPKSIPLQPFLNSLFLNHCAISQEYNALTSQNNLVRNETLFEQCGYGYVACRVTAHSKFHLEVLIDER